MDFRRTSCLSATVSTYQEALEKCEKSFDVGPSKFDTLVELKRHCLKGLGWYAEAISDMKLAPKQLKIFSELGRISKLERLSIEVAEDILK